MFLQTLCDIVRLLVVTMRPAEKQEEYFATEELGLLKMFCSCANVLYN